MTSKQRSPLNKIVRTRKKFVEVSASPGSGKTHALIQRVLYLVSIGVPPEEILVLSFSNVSVRVICRRLDLSLDLYSESTSVPVPISIPIPKSKFSSRPTSVTQSKHRSLSTSVDPALLKAVTVKTAHGFANSLLDNKTVMNEKTANEFVSSAINLAIKDCCKGLSSSSKNKAKFKTIHDLLKSKLKTVLSFFSVVSASKKKVSEVLKMSRFLELQSFGKVPLSFSELGLTSLTLSAHKIGGPLGIGALVLKRGIEIPALLHGGGQEREIRSGTLNTPSIVAFATAIASHQYRSDGRSLRREQRQMEWSTRHQRTPRSFHCA